MIVQRLHTYSTVPDWVTVGHAGRKLVFVHLAPNNTGDDSEVVAIENRAHRREHADEELSTISLYGHGVLRIGNRIILPDRYGARAASWHSRY